MCIIFLLTVLNMKSEIRLDMYNVPSLYFLYMCVHICICFNGILQYVDILALNSIMCILILVHNMLII